MKKTEQAKDKSAAYYRLNTKAVDDLVSAAPENTPRYSKEELNKYRSGKTKWKLPDWLKVVFIKFWFYGAVCFFVFWGLGLYVGNQLDMLFIAAIILGMVTDLLINHFLRFTEKLPGGNAKWIMVTKRGAIGFVTNLAYGFLLMFLVVTVYQIINTLLTTLGLPVLGVEPLGFGLITMGLDTLCVTCKNTILKIIADAKRR